MSKKNDKDLRFDTKLIHAGDPEERIEGAVSLPVFQSSTFEFGGQADYHDIKYIRLNNTPNHQVLHRKLAALENAQDALVTSSGMAAITTALLSVLSAGDHLLAHETLYGGTHNFIDQDFRDLGIEIDYIDPNDPDSWEDHLRASTKAIYVETISNPLIGVGDLEAAAAFAKEYGLISLIDNTFASPLNFRPAEWGFDLSLHSATKSLNGHTDIVAGAIIGKALLVRRARHKLNHLGGSLDPHACFLLQRGMKTLGVRMRHQNASAQRIAEFLEEHSGVSQVHYPGLASHPDHERASRLLDGFGSMLSFELKGGVEEADAFLNALELPISAPSLGGVESLITRPATTSHVGMTPEQRRRAGISDTLIRFSVGIEDPDDLLADLTQALEKAAVTVRTA
ncbi:MAG TPA: aminotransferase class I/II-fold pyridoxal phosphate-dependent enzyme [Acidobacteriota bacterium]|nr:aminotransferase class I/II-fold pyridoxal phosphate-dependent enzyme [Acidobacteriota bacterium]